MYVLVIANRPNNQMERDKSGYRSFEDEADVHEGQRGSETRPSENVWLLELPAQTAQFASLVSAASRKAFGLRVLYFRDAPEEISLFHPSSDAGQ